MIEALLVEDNRQISENISEYLKNEFHVTPVYNGSEALDTLETGEYDIVILDLMLPGVDGMTILSHIKKKDTNTGVIILTAKEELGEKLRAFGIGANDYLTKPFFMEELKARMYAILRTLGKITAQNHLTLRELTMDTRAKSVRVKTDGGDTELVLPEKLYALLEYLLLNKGILLFKEQIFDRICGYDSEATEQIVEVYISHLRKKLSPFGLDKYIVTKRGMGYKLDETAGEKG